MQNLENPAGIERLFRYNEAEFRKEFNIIYPSLTGSLLADFWYIRLNFNENTVQSGNSRRDLFFVIVTSLLAGLIAKLYIVLGLDKELYIMKSAGFIFLPFLTAYFLLKTNAGLKNFLITGCIFVGALTFINILPDEKTGDVLRLSCIHLPLFLWSVMGLAFIGGSFKNYKKSFEFLRYNGDLIVMTTIILITGAIMSAVTIGLFDLINFGVDFYTNYIVVCGLAASPIVGTYIIMKNPRIINKVSPMIARIFSPVVLTILVFYLIAMLVTGKDPYNDREFLLRFNILLIGVIALIVFSLTESIRENRTKANILILFCLSAVTVIVNFIALSAILFRISEWGITPNRLAVMGGNILILINLLIVTANLFKIIFRKTDINITIVEKSISYFLPVYTTWTFVVTFIFPFIFGFSR